MSRSLQEEPSVQLQSRKQRTMQPIKTVYSLIVLKKHRGGPERLKNGAEAAWIHGKGPRWAHSRAVRCAPPDGSGACFWYPAQLRVANEESERAVLCVVHTGGWPPRAQKSFSRRCLLRRKVEAPAVDMPCIQHDDGRRKAGCVLPHALPCCRAGASIRRASRVPRRCCTCRGFSSCEASGGLIHV